MDARILRRLAPRITYANVVASIALFLALGGGAMASGKLVGSRSDKTIRACYLKRGHDAGGVRIVKKGVRCRPAEVAIKWSQQGPAGPQGPPGLAGATGAQGPVGPQGPTGDAGAPGQDGADGKNGKDGVDGKNGVDGTDGNDGKDGVDGQNATVAGEAAGANCSAGGVKVTAANGAQFVCNGATGVPGTTGQSVQEKYGSSSLSLSAGNTSFQQIPGLSATVTVPANSTVEVSTDGGLQTTSSAAGGFSSAYLALTVDGFLMPVGGGYQRIDTVNATGQSGSIRNWSLFETVSPGTGSHTFSVMAAGTGGGSDAKVSGDVNSVLQGTLTITIIKTG